MTVIDYSLGGLAAASGLSAQESALVAELVRVLETNRARNATLEAYYGGDVTLRNIGIAVPDTSYAIVARDVKAHCDWPAIAVDRLAERSMFDGFTFAGADPDGAAAFQRLADRCEIAHKYDMMLPMMQVHGCAFWTVGRGPLGAVVRTHTATSASAIWDGSRDRIRAGLAVVGTGWDARWSREVVTDVDVHTPEAVIELRRSAADPDAGWAASVRPHAMGRPMMEAFAFNANERWRFGQSRISRQVRAIADSMMRESFRLEVAAELNVLPQKWVAGLTTQQFDEMVSDKFRHAVGSMLLLTKEDPADPNPAVGQFPQVTLQPHIDVKRDLAADFSGITGIPMSQLGVTHDNPSSAEAIEAAEKPLVTICERMNRSMARGLRNVALMAMCVERGKGWSDLDEVELSVAAHFRDPSMPSAAAETDRAIKVASAAPAYADTEQFWMDVGKDEGERRRIMADLRRAQARMGATAILDRNRRVMGLEDDGRGAGQVQAQPGRGGGQGA